MKKFLCMSITIVMLLCAVSTAYSRDTYVRGHTRRDGTYVQPHYRTSPNSTRNDNYSTRGNINPYTGQHGTQHRDYGYRGGRSWGGSNSYGGYRNYGSSYRGWENLLTSAAFYGVLSAWSLENS